MRNRVISVLLALMLALSLAPAGALAVEEENQSGTSSSQEEGKKTPEQIQEEERAFLNAPGYLHSGDVTAEKMTREEISRLLTETPARMPESIYIEEPSFTSPYRPGKVKAEVLQMAANRLTALRAIAGLPPVELDQDLCDNAQYGAVLIAVSEFSHYPPKPTDMSDAFYQEGQAAASSSNIYSGGDLIAAVDSFMSDANNLTVGSVGHRNWQLTPELKKVGFGCARCSTEKVFDNSGRPVDYRFISWPSSGYFPSSLFEKDVIWSIRVNSDAYQIAEDTSVVLTRKEDGKSWTFSPQEHYTAAESGKYFTRGDDQLTFRPDGIETYEGVYTVKVNGIKDIKGAPVDFSYQVDFFDYRNYVDTVVTEVAVNGWRSFHIPKDMAEEEYLEALAALLPDQVTISTEIGRVVTAKTQGEWRLDKENHRWVNSVDPAELPDKVTDPQGVLRGISIGYSLDDYTGILSLTPVLPKVGASARFSLQRYMISTDTGELYRISKTDDRTVLTKYYDSKTSGLQEDGSGNYLFAVDSWRREDTGEWLALYYSESDGDVYAVFHHVCPSEELNDVSTSDWFHTAVDDMVNRGLMFGVSEHEFAPNIGTTRAMLVTILHRLEGSPTTSSASAFTDVQAGDWFAGPVSWAASNGIVNGYGDGTFGPNDTLTREQMATILYRYAQGKGKDMTLGELNGYIDAGQISEWALQAMRWANRAGIITGMTENTLEPQGPLTRAQMATILMRYLG